MDIQGRNADQRQVPGQRQSFHQWQPHSQARERARSQGNTQGLNLIHAHFAAPQEFCDRRRQLDRVVPAALPGGFAPDLRPIIERDPDLRGGGVDRQQHHSAP